MPTVSDAPASAAERILADMTLEQKVAQLLWETPEQLTGIGVATAAGDTTREALAAIPVGGLVYFSQNIVDADQLTGMLAASQDMSREVGGGVPLFLGVDEEGGPLVARVANSGIFDVPTFPNMAEVGATGDTAQAAQVGSTIGGYLADIGFNVDFAPVADVLTNPANTVIGPRAFGSDPQLVAGMVAAEVEAMTQTGVLPCPKHFPGHGQTAGDSHTGVAVSDRTLDELRACEFLPFKAAIEAGAPFVMVGHIKTPAASGDDLPATLSPTAIDGWLRGELGFAGVVVSDSFAMGAIADYYDQTDAAVRFLQAGGDLILMTPTPEETYQGILAAVGDGTLTESRIDEGVLRILAAKDALGLLA